MSSGGVFSLASYPKNLNIQRPEKNKNTHRHFRRASWGKKIGNSSVCCTRFAEVVFRLQFHEQKRVRQSIAAAARLTELHDLWRRREGGREGGKNACTSVEVRKQLGWTPKPEVGEEEEGFRSNVLSLCSHCSQSWYGSDTSCKKKRSSIKSSSWSSPLGPDSLHLCLAIQCR